MMKKILVVLVGLCLTLPSWSQITPHQNRVVNGLFEDRTEIYFSFDMDQRSEIHHLTSIVSIDKVDNLKVYAYANRAEFEAFLLTGHAYRVLTKPSELEKVEMMLDEDFQNKTLSFSAYPTYPQYVTMMEDWAAAYPEICQLVQIGTTVNGRKLLFLKITDNLSQREYEPQFMYTSTMHGDETAGYIMMLKMIDYLLTGYGTDPRATNLINEMEIWINPLANPDGTYFAGDNTVNGAIRYNGNNVDLNRNYWDPQDGAHPDGLAYQPETQAFMGFADTMDFVMAANFHGGAEVFNYPWDTKVNDHPDRNWFMQFGLDYVDTVHTYSAANYFIDNTTGFDANGVTNGFAWYEVNGGRQDYMNAARHCRELTIELSTTKLIPVSDFEPKWTANKNALLYFMEETFNGFHGLVTDACTGQGVKAKVFVEGHDADSSHVYASLPLGNYYRPIYPGTYSVTYSAPGYQSVTLDNVVVTAGQGVVHDVVLQPLAPTANFSADHTSGCGGAVNFTDLTGSATSWSWDFGDGSFSNEPNPSHVYAQSGAYTVTLSVTNCVSADDEIKTDYIQVTVMPMPTPGQLEYSSCSSQSFDLTATASGEVQWYDAPTGGNLLATGDTYTTPVLTSSADYYVQSVVMGDSATVGSSDYSANGGFYTGPTYRYLIFDVLAACTLTSVEINANNAGDRTIELRDNAGTVLQSLTVNIPAGWSVVNLGFALTPGTGYQLGTAGANQLYRNTSGATYPYTSSLVNITGNNANPSAYYYFYNWKLTDQCASERLPVHVSVGNSGLPAVSLSAPNVICSGNPVTVDALPSNVSNPQYTWTIDGTVNAETGSSITLANATDGTVVVCDLIDPTNCSGTTTASATTTLTVTATPNAPVIVSQNFVLSSDITTGLQWYLNGVAIAGATTSPWTATENGVYTATASNGTCVSAVSNAFNIVIEQVQQLHVPTLQMFPNPASSEVRVRSGFANGCTVKVYTVLGEGLMQFKATRSEFTLPVAQWDCGVYLIQLQGDEGTVTQRLTIYR